MIYGYARVSTDGQTLVAQWEQLKAAGAEKVFEEKASGAKSDRQQLGRLLGVLSTDDVVLVTRLDRLARSTRDLLNVLAGIAERGAAFRSLADQWADTTTPHGRLMLTVLGGLAEFERELIRARTSEGRARAKQAGRSLGRPFKLTPHQQAEALKRKLAGEPVREVAKTYAVSASTISRLQWEEWYMQPLEARSMCPDNPLSGASNQPDASGEELRRIFNAASAVSWADHLRDELAYRHMIQLADVFEGWALDEQLNPEQTVKLVGWSESLRQLAELVGPNWDPPAPEQLTLVGLIGRRLLDE
jgi:DNA invertase Pin-like site-specific DNA recombinase